MITPFDGNFRIDNFTISQQLLINGYVILSKVPDINSVTFIISETDDILSYQYSVEKVTLENQIFYSDAIIDQYVITWLDHSSSSSSGTTSEIALLLEARLNDMIQIRYLSV